MTHPLRSTLLALAALALATGCNPDPDDDDDGYPASEDCDDSDAGVNPAAQEICNGVDDDCDYQVDEGAEDATTWYIDLDGDGYGSATEVSACDQPAGTAEEGGDCDDLDPDSWPGAPELCDGADNDCDGELDEEAGDLQTFWTDADADGYGDPDAPVEACDQPRGTSIHDTDCDDDDASAHPGGVEVCDGDDDDCDGTVDEDDAVDAPTWYADSDGDGWGDSEVSERACEAPEGHVADDGDCDDATADAYPGNTEVCDGIDNDCDGRTDGSDATDAELYHADADADGYGDPTAWKLACEVPSGYVDDISDCDDSDGDVNPGATETCNDADDDCDGTVDEDDASDASTWYADVDGDGYYGEGVTTVACDQPTGWGDEADDCDDTDADVNPGATEICGNLTDDDCDDDDSVCRLEGEVEADDADVRIEGYSSYNYGGLSHAVLDMDADGATDVFVGTYGHSSYRGAAWGVAGPLAGIESLRSYEWEVYGDSSYDYLGVAMNRAGDVNGDGFEDLAVGAVYDSYYYSDAGTVGVFFGPLLGDEYAQSDADVIIYGSSSYAYAGYDVGMPGDFDGDGTDDLLVAAYNDESTGNDYGLVGIFLGPITAGDYDLDDADVLIEGTTSNGYFGYSATYLGDMDGDGADDIYVGARYDSSLSSSSRGAGYLFYGGMSDGTYDAYADADATITAASTGSWDYYIGAMARPAGDLDGDGYADLLTGDPYDETNTYWAGAYLVFYGPLSGAYDETDADVAIRCEDMDSYCGTYWWGSSSGRSGWGGDLDGDGTDDLVVAEMGHSWSSSDDGIVAVFYGGSLSGDYDISDADLVIYGSSSGDYLGNGLVVEDVDGDGYDDIVVGAAYADDYSSEAGTSYVFYGTGQ